MGTCIVSLIKWQNSMSKISFHLKITLICQLCKCIIRTLSLHFDEESFPEALIQMYSTFRRKFDT